MPGYEVTLWNGLLAPAKTPPEIIDRINRAAIDALRSEEVKAKLAEQGSEPVGNSPAEFKAFIGSELVEMEEAGGDLGRDRAIDLKRCSASPSC